MAGRLGLPRFPGSPLIVAAPVTRCGTTLLQRLFSTGTDGIVFGEHVAAALQELVRALLEQEGKHRVREEGCRRELERVLAGEQLWCPGLMPDVERYLELWRDALARFLAFHEREARRLGRRTWGTKHPTLALETLVALRELVPGSRILYVVRDVFAAARSVKARRFARTPQELASFASKWSAGVVGIARLADDPGVRVLRHEELERIDAAGLSELEDFTGIRGLSRTALERRVNTFTGELEAGHAPDQYIAPADLTDEEHSLVAEHARAGLTLLAPAPA
jgi:hypothetical protein